MVAFNAAHVNQSRRRTDVAKDGFDRDIAIEGNPRRLFAQTASSGDVIDIWNDTDSRAEGRGLASRGVTFAVSENTNQSLALSQSGENEESGSDGYVPTVSETRRRYDLKHAVVRMLRNGLKEDERSRSVCGCGFAATDLEAGGKRSEVTVHRNGQNRAWVSGVHRCKSGWLCPTCAPAVARRRQEAVQQVVKATTDKEGLFLMGLVTVRHLKKDPLAKVKKMVTESFAAARRQKNWERAEQAAGVAGVLVAPEVTYGRHGWNLHIHFGLPCLPRLPTCDADSKLTADERKAIKEAALAAAATAAEQAGQILIENYRRQIAKRGGTTVGDAQGVQVAASGEAASEYIAKGASWELAGGNAYKDDVKGLSIWQIVADADEGDIDSFALFREYADVMPGTKSCVITKRLKKNLGLLGFHDDEDDEEGGIQNFDDDGAIVGRLRSEFWHLFLKTKLAGTFLSRIEAVADFDKPDLFATEFDKIVDETLDAADARERVITSKRARKILDTEGHAATRIMLARNVAYRVRSAQALGRASETITACIETLHAEGHPDAALPTPSDVVKEIARLDRVASKATATPRACPMPVSGARSAVKNAR